MLALGFHVLPSPDRSPLAIRHDCCCNIRVSNTVTTISNTVTTLVVLITIVATVPYCPLDLGFANDKGPVEGRETTLNCIVEGTQ